jgi:hypothetical protein
MSRNLYTIATISSACDFGLRAVIAQRDDEKVVAAEEFLREAVAAQEARVAFYRVILDGWNTTHRELCSPLRRLSYTLGRRIGELTRNGYALLGPDELACLEEVETPPIDRSENLGWHAMTAFWEALRHAGLSGQGTRCRVVVTWRVLFASFGDEDFWPS